MGEGLSRIQIAVYGALGVALLLLGVKALRGADAPAASGGDEGRVLAAEPIGSAGGPGGGDLVVHVAGEVAEPGVYRLAAGSRVGDALKRAGGPTRKGSADAINLAARLGDGQQVVVPARSASRAVSANAAVEGPISLGSADAADLERLDGIGPVTAEKIIEYRDQSGGVGSIEQLDEIPGIGSATIESLSEQLQP